MRRPVRTSDPASAELIDAVRWYEERRPGLGGEFFDALGPDRDALEEGATLVVTRLADREHRVEMDVGLDQRRRDQGALELDDLGGLRLGGRPAAGEHPEVPRPLLACHPGASQEQVEHARTLINFCSPTLEPAGS